MGNKGAPEEWTVHSRHPSSCSCQSVAYFSDMKNSQPSPGGVLGTIEEMTLLQTATHVQIT